MEFTVGKHLGRRFVPVLSAGILMAAAARSAEPLRTFRDTTERSFDGKVTAFDATSQVVTLQRADGKTGKMPLNSLSAEDQRYVREWGLSNDFSNVVGIAVQLQSSDVTDETTSSRSKLIKDFHYAVELKNSSTSLFENIDVEYCIFYRQGERDGSTINYDEGTCYGRTKLESLGPVSARLLETKHVRLYTQSGIQTIFGTSDNFSNADIRGIWLRLKLKLPSKMVIEREFRSADDEMWKWTPYSIGAGMNQGSNAYQFLLK